LSIGKLKIYLSKCLKLIDVSMIKNIRCFSFRKKLKKLNIC